MLEFVIPCLLGLESLVGDEIKKLGLSDVRVENGRVLCRGEARDIARLAAAEDAAVLDAHVRKTHLSDLIADETFQSQQAGNDKFQHNNAPEKMICS